VTSTQNDPTSPGRRTPHGHRRIGVRTNSAVRAILTLLVVAGLGVDAYIHFDLAAAYDVIKTSAVSQGTLFRAEAIAAIAAAITVVIRPRRHNAMLAFAVAASALAAVLVYRYINVGRLGPIPSMYEPVWYPQKTQGAWAETIAVLASAALILATPHPRRPRRDTPTASLGGWCQTTRF
jgi:hypothetical protein